MSRKLATFEILKRTNRHCEVDGMECRTDYSAASRNRKRQAEKWRQKYLNAENAEIGGEAQRRKLRFKAAQ
jgi:hypothetical protein